MRDVRRSEMQRARAARELIHSTRGSESMALRAFMAIFHPDKQNYLQAQVDRLEHDKRKRRRASGERTK